MEPNYRIVEYVAADGATPFSSWLRRLPDVKTKAKALLRFKRCELGNVGTHRSVGGGLMELVVDTGPGYRVYFALVGPRNLLLLAGGSKGSQRRDIASARKRWHDFKGRSSSAEIES